MTEVSKRADSGAEGSTTAAEQISRESDEKEYGLLSVADRTRLLTETFITVSGLVSFVFTVSTSQLHAGDDVKSNTRRNSQWPWKELDRYTEPINTFFHRISISGR